PVKEGWVTKSLSSESNYAQSESKGGRE
ncbi:unnamed protein product, partial [Allacma fusca]